MKNKKEEIKNIINKNNKLIQRNNINCKLKYITAKSAFNIFYKQEIKQLKIHAINYSGAEKIFFNYGLFKINKIHNIELCAIPIRAIIDILYHNIFVLNVFPHSIDDIKNDFIFDEINKNELKKKLNILKQYLVTYEQKQNLEKWKKLNL
jgi:hypothetical protein